MAEGRILIVEDNGIVVMEIEERLADLGYQVVGDASTGEKAIEKAGHARPDLVLMDIQLKSDMDGIQAAQVIQEQFDIPVVYLTAHTDESTLKRAKVTEPFGYIVKPFNERELYVAIEIALSKHKLEQQLKERERWLATVLRSIGDAVLTTGPDGRITSLNPQAEQLVNVAQDAAAGQPITAAFQIYNEAAHSANENLIYQVLKRGQAAHFSNYTLVAAGGMQAAVDGVATPIRDEKDNLQGMVLVLHDISERNRMEAAIKERDERYALAMAGANDGLWDWDLRTQDIYYSTRWKAMIGYENDGLRNHPDEWFGRVHPKDVDQLKGIMDAHLKGLIPHFENEHRVRHVDGAYRWVLCRGLAVRDGNGAAYRMAGSLTDITERKRTEEKLFHEAFYDTLTNLPNRALFKERLSHAIAIAHRRPESRFAVLFMDLDRFKNINDSLGHLTGDQLLVACARRLEACLRPTDTVARLGGDEFVALLQGIHDEHDALLVAERIQKELMSPFHLQGQELFTTASIGIVVSSNKYHDLEDILRDADIAMYHAKASGRARSRVFDAGMREHIMQRMTIETELRRALERQELRVYYQPVVSLSSHKIVGFEALVRWQHPRLGLLTPAQFITVAEEAGLITAIDLWVLREACRQMIEWKNRFPFEPSLSVSVNFSSQHFSQPNLAQGIAQILAETGFDARKLNIEITETGLVEHGRQTSGLLFQLAQMGVSLQIDDFGIGYSALSYLQSFPISGLKIDRAFINNLDMETSKSRITQTITTLAHNLDLDVVAEGIETAAESLHIQQIGCDYAQGFFYSKPCDREAAEALLERTCLAGEPLGLSGPGA